MVNEDFREEVNKGHEEGEECDVVEAVGAERSRLANSQHQDNRQQSHTLPVLVLSVEHRGESVPGAGRY